MVRHKTTFHRAPKARYDLAIPGWLRLVPGDDVVSAIRSDYAAMSEEMVFGNAPTLAEVLGVLKEIEAAING